MRVLFFIIFFLPLVVYGQCNGSQSFTLNPPPVNNQYNPGQVVQACYTMVGYNEVSTNWLEGFDLTLGPGWSNVSPVTAPNNCGGVGSGGAWLWSTTVTSSSTGIPFGPGYFFNLNTNDNDPGNDFGDQNMSNCTWSFCISLTVANSSCLSQSLLLQVTAGGDGTMGSWTSNSCGLTPFTIFNGTVGVIPPTIGQISHN